MSVCVCMHVCVRTRETVKAQDEPVTETNGKPVNEIKRKSLTHCCDIVQVTSYHGAFLILCSQQRDHNLHLQDSLPWAPGRYIYTYIYIQHTQVSAEGITLHDFFFAYT